jgi:hypothetical protein
MGLGRIIESGDPGFAVEQHRTASDAVEKIEEDL